MKQPYQLKTFVANRVATIQDFSCDEQWSHTSSVDNPAELISRGVNPSKMLESHLFVHNCKSGIEKRFGHLTGIEIEEAEQILVKFVQASEFSKEFNALRAIGEVNVDS
ncbi:hypothetical protein NPIL_415391 [Nephila pilipes]|uniref:Uncharacterized protein n=1 Tax=Nephila pilipes TaxID=299642 RepID=A0A8X6NN76_NEPPI|nr:hypothetical protein NPIL_415391 [Nephila pilipes]